MHYTKLAVPDMKQAVHSLLLSVLSPMPSLAAVLLRSPNHIFNVLPNEINADILGKRDYIPYAQSCCLIHEDMF